MNVRFKTIITFSAASLMGIIFLWIFNIFYVLRNWTMFLDGLSLFLGIVFCLIIVSDVVIWFVFRPAVLVENKVSSGKVLIDIEGIAVDKVLQRMPALIFATNAIGFLIGPLIKRIVSVSISGQNPFNFVTLSTVIYSVSIGLYIAFIEIRLIEGYFLPLQIAQNRCTIESMKTRRWSGRQFSLTAIILILVFGLFFSAGQGYLLEELYAPANLSSEVITEAAVEADETSGASEYEETDTDSQVNEVPDSVEIDTVSGASKTISNRIDLWERALGGEVIVLDADHPQIKGRLSEYTLKMVLLGVIAALLSLIGVSVEVRTTKARLDEMNERLKEIGEGRVDETRKLMIIQADELGLTAHWINVFIDKQAAIMSTIRDSINSLGDTSGELNRINITAKNLGVGIEGGIKKIQDNIEKQHQALDGVEKSIHELGDTILKTNSNLAKQNEAMSSNTVSMEEMTANIGSVSKNSQDAFDNTQILISDAEQSSTDMNILQKGITEIADFASEVSSSVGQISKIAAQTNLLAMNAAIEAAHAGDVGTGFAVVASEVSKLAEDSSVTTKSITELIRKMDQLSGNGLIQADNAKNSFNEIHRRVKNNSMLIAEISESMKEQEIGSLEMQKAMEMLKELTDDVSKITDTQKTQRTNVEEAMQYLTGAANDIQEQMDRIVTMMTDFENFISVLGIVIDKNAVLVKDLKEISGV